MSLNWTEFEAIGHRGNSEWTGESIEEMLEHVQDHCKRMLADFEPVAKLMAYWNGCAVELPKDWLDKFNEMGASYSCAPTRIYEDEDWKRQMDLS